MNFLCPYKATEQLDPKMQVWFDNLHNDLESIDVNSLNLRFKDVLKLGNIFNLVEIFTEIFKDYEDKEECFNNHIKTFLYLLNKKDIDITNKDPMLLYTVLFNDNQGNTSGFNFKDNTSYAIEFNPWNEWMNYFVSQDNIDSIGLDNFIAWSIWEMTFIGFDEEEIQSEFNNIKDILKNAQEEHYKSNRDKLKLV